MRVNNPNPIIYPYDFQEEKSSKGQYGFDFLFVCQRKIDNIRRLSVSTNVESKEKYTLFIFPDNMIFPTMHDARTVKEINSLLLEKIVL